MATAMTSRTPGGAPPLPSRNQNQTNRLPQRSKTQHPPQVAVTHGRPPPGRSQSEDTPPPVPPPSTRRRISEPKVGVVSNNRDGHAGGNWDRPPPPVPGRTPTEDADAQRGIVKKSFETKSFINRNTARIMSNPDAVQPPPPPSTRTLPRGRMRDVYDAEAPDEHNSHRDTPPDLPPSRPPKSAPKSGPASSVSDLERRFTFHSTLDFPVPEPLSTPKKTYPSLSESVSSKTSGMHLGHL